MAEKKRGDSVEEVLLKDIKASVDKHAHSATFACGGSVPFKTTKMKKEASETPPDTTEEANTTTTEIDPVQIRFGENGKGITVHIPTNDENIKQLEDLITACEPASFGRGGEAVLDEDYRKAGKLDRSDFATSFCPYEAGIVDIVAQLLLPQLKYDKDLRSVKAELYKLNVYSAPSGKFKAHVDTPRSKNQFGSLVVALPVSHDGGALVVRNAGKDITFDWSTTDAGHDADNTKPAIKWAAFYSDCEHEVLEVTTGHRVTLTYNLYVTRGLGHLAGSASGLDATQLPLYKALHEALKVPKFLRGGRVLAVWLNHSYAHTNKHTNFLPSSLKGADMSLYETARALGLMCLLVPIITMRGYYSGNTYVAKSKFFPFNEGWSVDGFAFDEYGSQCWGNELPAGRVTWINEAAAGDGKKKSKDEKKDEKEEDLKEVQMAYLAYGNEPDIDIHYSRAAMLIRIPPFRERGVVKKGPKSIWTGIQDDYDEDGDNEDDY